MRSTLSIFGLLACLFAGGCVEATFSLAHGSPLPKGLCDDAQAQRAATTSSRIELWLYTYDPPRLKFYRHDTVFFTRSGDAGEVGDISFNGVPSSLHRVANPNVVTFDGDDESSPVPREGS